MICKHILDNIFKRAWDYFSHTVKWFQVFLVFLSNTINFIYYYHLFALS